MPTLWDRLNGALGAFWPLQPTRSRGRPYRPPGQRREHVGEALSRWATRTVEKIRSHAFAGQLRFLPWLDHYTDETHEIRAEYPKMMRDGTIKAGFLTKVLAVCQLPLQVHPVDADHPRDQHCAELVKHAYETIGITEKNGRRRPASAWAGTVGCAWSILAGGVMRGHSVNELIWEEDVIQRGKFRGKRRWRALKSKDTNYLQLSVDQYRNITAIRGTAYNAGKVFNPEDFVIYTYLPFFESPVGTSDFRAAYRHYWYKDTLLKIQSLHLEKYTGPFLQGTYGTPAQKAALEQAFENARGGGWITIPTGALVEATSLAVSGTTDFEGAIRYHDQQMLIALVGAHLQILEGQVTNNRGDTREHRQTSELFQWLLAETLTGIYKTQMVPDLVAENYHDVEPPNITLGAVSEKELEARARLNDMLQKQGFKLSKKEEYSYFGRSEPTDPDDILEPPGAGGPPGGDDGGAGGLAGLLGGGGGGNGQAGEPEEEEPEAEAEPFAEGEPCKKGEAASKTGCTPAGGKSGQKLTRQERNQQGRAAGTTRAQQEAWQARQAAGDHPLARPAANVLGNVYESAAGIGSQQEARLILDPKRAAARVKADVEQEATRALAPVREWTQDRFGRQAGTVNRRLAALVRELASTTANGTRGSLAFAQEHVRYGKPAMREKLREALQEEANPATAASRFEDVFGTPDDPGALMDVLGDDLADWPVNLAALAERGKPAADLAAALQRATGTDLPPQAGEDGWDYWERADEAVLDPLRQQAVQELYEQVRARLLPRGTATLSEDEHDWAAMSEADWQAFAAEDGWEKHKITRGPRKGQSVERKKLPSGSYVYRDTGAGAAKEKAAREKETARRAAAKAKEKERKAAEKEAAKAGEKKTKALSSLREITAGRQKPTPARVRDIGAVLVTLKADELKALKAELGVKGGSTKAQMVEKIQERALAKPEGKAAKPAAKPARVKPEPKAPQPAAAATKKPWQMTKEEFAANPPTGFTYKPSEGENIARYLPDGRIMLTDSFFDHSAEDQKYILAHEKGHGIVDHVSKDADQFWPLVDSGLLGEYDEEKGRFVGISRSQRNADEVLADAVADFNLDPEKLKAKHPALYVLAEELSGGGKVTPQLIEKAKKAAEDKAVPPPASAGPPQPPEPGFTGTDSLGREWVNGKLVAKREEPKKARPAAAPKAAPTPSVPPAPTPLTPAHVQEFEDALGAASVLSGGNWDAHEPGQTDALRRQLIKQTKQDLSPEQMNGIVTELIRENILRPFITNEARAVAEDPQWNPSALRVGGKLYGHVGLVKGQEARLREVLGEIASGQRPVQPVQGGNEINHPADLIKKDRSNPQPPEPRFTGTDSLGREWRDGKLVAAQEKPAAKPARAKPEPKAKPKPEPVAGTDVQAVRQDAQRIIDRITSADPLLTPGDVKAVEDQLRSLSLPELQAIWTDQFGMSSKLKSLSDARAKVGSFMSNNRAAYVRGLQGGIEGDILYGLQSGAAMAATGEGRLEEAIALGKQRVEAYAQEYLPELGERYGIDRRLPRAERVRLAKEGLEREAHQAMTTKLEEIGFTGTDALGREWRDGKLVAKAEEATTARPAAAKPAAPPSPAPAAAPASVAPPPVDYRPLNQPGMPGDGARIPVYDRDDLDPDFSLPNEPELMRATLLAAEKVARENYSVVLTSGLYEEVRKTRLDLTANDFLTQLVAWQKRGIISLGVVNDPHLIPREDLEKMPMVRQWSAQVADSDERLRGFFNPTVSAEAKALAAQAR